MKNYIKYNGYVGTVEYTAEDDILFGSILGIRGLFSYEGESLAEIKAAFREAVDEYLLFCDEKGIEPERPSVDIDEAQKTA